MYPDMQAMSLPLMRYLWRDNQLPSVVRHVALPIVTYTSLTAIVTCRSLATLIVCYALPLNSFAILTLYFHLNLHFTYIFTYIVTMAATIANSITWIITSNYSKTFIKNAVPLLTISLARRQVKSREVLLINNTTVCRTFRQQADSRDN